MSEREKEMLVDPLLAKGLKQEGVQIGKEEMLEEVIDIIESYKWAFIDSELYRDMYFKIKDLV